MKPNQLLAALAVVFAGLFAACGGSKAPSNTFVANLSGVKEVPPVPTSATGTATFTLSGATMNYTITASGLSSNAFASHIHVGSASVAGPVVVPIVPTPQTTTPSMSGSFTAANITTGTTGVVTMDDLVAQIRAGNTYFNIHTTTNQGGEIRGQLAAQ